MITNEKVEFKAQFDDSEEVPVIIIERDDESGSFSSTPQNNIKKPHRRWPWIAGSIAATLLLVAVALGGILWYRYHVNIGVQISCTPEENIEKLKVQTLEHIQPEVCAVSDTILDVALNIYELRGLRAEISFEEPDTLDESVFLYMRCADHNDEGPKYKGSIVANGQELENDGSTRLGYCGMVGDRTVIGISRSDAVKDFVISNNGSFFRQFILVSNHELPSRFHLHGKVERCALGRINDQLYYIKTQNRETLWDFADALREYGFIDAIYITGGNENYSYYRTADGTRHDIGDPESYPFTKWKGNVPWLVFKR